MNMTRRKSTSADPVREVFNAVIGEGTSCCGGGTKLGRMFLDILENENEFEIQASVPGYGREDLTIDLENGVLNLQARLPEKEEGTSDEGDCCSGGHTEAGRYLRRERFTGNLARTIRLPESIDENGLVASLADGVLTVTLPKVARPEPRRIEIV